jgi:tRNA-guanine family transglycosylase
MVGCTCHGCRHHTRAYIHHLHLSHEILAEVLLYHHNLHQLRRLFASARQAMQDNSFGQWVLDMEAQL